MKKLFFKLTAFSLAATLISTSCKKDYNIQPIQPKIEFPQKIDPIPIDLRLSIDLAAESINFSVVKAVNKFNALVKIEGVVRNVGRLNYTSGVNQQCAYLYQKYFWGTPRLVASQQFQNLAVNSTVKVSFTRYWNQSSPAEGEFPPSYILVIGFDPDIFLDGNLNNDDGNSNNNRREKSGSIINSFNFLLAEDE